MSHSIRPPAAALALSLVPALALLCAGCATDHSRPAPAALPAAFAHAGADQPPHWPDAQFLQSFASPELDRLSALAVAHNVDLAAAEGRVRQADARARQAGAAILPSVDAIGTATQFAGRSGGTNGQELDYGLLLSASYEVDFWGRNHALARAARAQAASSRDELATVRLTTLAGLASTYFTLQSLRERIALAQQDLASARALLGVVEARYAAGAMNQSELAAQRAAVASASLPIPALQQQALEALDAIALLVGAAPEGFQVATERLDGIHEPLLAPGLPSELLERRPDIMAAEDGLVAAHADLRAARAALFPTLTLAVTGGAQNPAVQAGFLALPGFGPALTVGGGLVQNIFDAGRRRAVIEEARGREAELLANYRGAILAGLADVENALGQRQHLDAQRGAEQDYLAQSERAFEAAQLRYRAGSGPFLAVLDAQRTLFAARAQLCQYRLSRLQAALGLSKALGGGWQAGPRPAPDLARTESPHDLSP